MTFLRENTCVSLTSEALVSVPNSVYHEVIETLASLLPAASCTAGAGIQCSWSQVSTSCILSKQLHVSRGIFSAAWEPQTKLLFLSLALPLNCQLTLKLFKSFILRFHIKRLGRLYFNVER